MLFVLACVPCGGPCAAGLAVEEGVSSEISHRWEGCLVSGARSSIWCQAPFLSLGAARRRCPCVLSVIGVGVGTQHRPHSVHSCRPALRAVGLAGGRSPGVLRGGGIPRCGEERLSSPGCATRCQGGQSGSAANVP